MKKWKRWIWKPQIQRNNEIHIVCMYVLNNLFIFHKCEIFLFVKRKKKLRSRHWRTICWMNINQGNTRKYKLELGNHFQFLKVQIGLLCGKFWGLKYFQGWRRTNSVATNCSHWSKGKNILIPQRNETSTLFDIDRNFPSGSSFGGLGKWCTGSQQCLGSRFSLCAHKAASRVFQFRGLWAEH